MDQGEKGEILDHRQDGNVVVGEITDLYLVER